MTGSVLTKQAVHEKLTKRRGAYARDLDSFLQFVLRDDASVLELDGDFKSLEGGTTYDFVLLPDTLNVLADVQKSLTEIRSKLCTDETRLVITFHNFLWKPILNLATWLGLRSAKPLQNWLTPGDVHALLTLSDFEIVREGERFLFPFSIPLLTPFFNRFLVKLPFFRWFALVHYVIARPIPAMRKEYSVSIVIPVRNEAGNLKRAIDTIPTFGTTMEILFIEGNSTDDTWERVLEVQRTYTGPHRIVSAKQSGKGKGDAVRKGFDMAKKDILMILDGDLTVDPSELPKFYDAIASGKGEFINGSRLVYPMEDEAMQTLNLFANKFFSLMFTWLLGQKIKDTLCGTKVIRRSDYANIAANRKYFGDFDPFGDFDLLLGAAKQNIRILEIPIRYRQRTYGSTNIQRFRHGWMLLEMCAFAASRIKFI